MFEINLHTYLFEDAFEARHHRSDRDLALWDRANTLFEHSYAHGRLVRAGLWIRGRARRLNYLNRIGCSGSHRYYAGLITVPLARIVGSEGHGDDFDRLFYPLNRRSRARWISVAMAQLEGVPLPPVELIQAGDSYFVRDGHHRIAVARALGQDYIDAEVTVWDVPSPMPYEAPAPQPWQAPGRWVATRLRRLLPGRSNPRVAWQ